MGSPLDPNLRQSPSGRHRGVGPGTGPQPVVLQRKGIVCTAEAEYETGGAQLPAPILIDTTPPGGQAAELSFSGVQQIKLNDLPIVRLYVDFRMAVFAATSAIPRVIVQADLGDGNSYVPIPGAEQVRLVGSGLNLQQWEMQGSIEIPELTTGDVAVRVMWENGTANNVLTRRTPGSNNSATDPGGWTLEAEIVQYTPDPVV